LVCTTIKEGMECPFMTAKGCSYNGGLTTAGFATRSWSSVMVAIAALSILPAGFAQHVLIRS